MKIYIMRHGDAATMQEAGVTTDEERPLTVLGREEVALMARLLDSLGARPDLILSSPLVRAWQTAEIVSGHFGNTPDLTRSVDMAPGGTHSGVLAQILRHGRPEHVLLTGHMPGVGSLAGYLAWNERNATISFRTAGICRIDLPDHSPAPGYGDVRWLIPPKVAARMLEASG